MGSGPTHTEPISQHEVSSPTGTVHGAEADYPCIALSLGPELRDVVQSSPLALTKNTMYLLAALHYGLLQLVIAGPGLSPSSSSDSSLCDSADKDTPTLLYALHIMWSHSCFLLWVRPGDFSRFSTIPEVMNSFVDLSQLKTEEDEKRALILIVYLTHKAAGPIKTERMTSDLDKGTLNPAGLISFVLTGQGES
ncbi:hypothetical protein F2P81_006099 [Scophthalmus maximus]|uniref:Uncharacterized protein n=1 Tax=Scophthalmus maximus TaxID=52904 RepID=A0A6A4T8B3_SCOMX|nr:hypothetical protein F2P81_006099 [Scophthalmus maximus]